MHTLRFFGLITAQAEERPELRERASCAKGRVPILTNIREDVDNSGAVISDFFGQRCKPMNVFVQS
jgi:hypothetical protein